MEAPFQLIFSAWRQPVGIQPPAANEILIGVR